jgi:uncharacterized protein (TIGR00369 family)
MTDGKFFPVTISMTVNFLRAARPGLITAEAQVTQLGKTVAFIEAKLMAEDGAVLVTAMASTRLVEAAKAFR